jgi:hypothetical protein
MQKQSEKRHRYKARERTPKADQSLRTEEPVKGDLDTKRENRRAEWNVNDEKQSLTIREKRRVSAATGNNAQSRLAQRGFKRESRKRVEHADAQSKNDEGVFGIISCLSRMIPIVKHLQGRTDEANQQDQSGNDSRGSGTHRGEYSTAYRGDLLEVSTTLEEERWGGV